MKHLGIILGSLIYCIAFDVFVREWLQLVVSMYIAWGIILLLQNGRKLLPVILTIISLQIGIAQRETRAVQLVFGVENVNSIALAKITKPVAIQMPYYSHYYNPNVGLQYRLTNNESNLYSRVALSGLSAGIELCVAPTIKLTRRYYTDKLKLGLFAEGIMDYSPQRYKPMLNFDIFPEDVGIRTIDEWLKSQEDKMKIPDYKNRHLANYAYGFLAKAPWSISENNQLIIYARVKAYGFINKVEAQLGIQWTMSKERLDYGSNARKIHH